MKLKKDILNQRLVEAKYAKTEPENIDMPVLGKIRFENHELNVYESVDEPIFLAVDVAKILDYSVGNTSHMLEVVEEDEKVLRNTRNSSTSNRGNPNKWFLTELGLYNVLSQSRKPIARVWRRVVHSQLIQMRKDKGYSIIEQFEEWERIADDIYVDEETGILMHSITVAGGDVDQITHEEWWNRYMEGK